VGGRNDNDDQERALLSFEAGDQGVGKVRVDDPVRNRLLADFSDFYVKISQISSLGQF
jgi:hypothetical protein